MQVVALIDEEDGRFGVSFPDFPGCTTIAKSLDKAVAKAAEVLAFHVNGLAEDGPVPIPRTLAQLRKDRSFVADAENAMAVLIPYAPPNEAVRVNVMLPKSLLVRLDQAAESSGESRSGFLAEAVQKRLTDIAGR